MSSNSHSEELKSMVEKCGKSDDEIADAITSRGVKTSGKWIWYLRRGNPSENTLRVMTLLDYLRGK